jgi:DNA-binding Lrp family transcriptional regulator
MTRIKTGAASVGNRAPPHGGEASRGVLSSASDDDGGGSLSAMREQLEIKVTAMVTAIVFVKADVARISEVAEQIAALRGVSEVYSVTGTIDLIAMIRVSNHDQVAEVVADRLNKVPGVVSTETHIAFRAYSAHDLEAAFSLGG